MVPIFQRVFAVVAVAVAILAIACGGAPDAEPKDPSGPTPTAIAGDPSPAATSAPSAATGQSTAAPLLPSGSAANEPYVPEDSVDTQDKRLNVTVGGKTVYIRNGGQVVLGDGLAVEIFADPYPPATLTSFLDFYLTRDGEPVTDASMGIEYDMLAMVHGPFNSVADNIGGGHYLFKLNYIMFGAWDQTVTVRIDLERIKLPVVLVAYP